MIQVPIEFLGKFDQAVKGLDNFTQQVGGNVNSIESKFSGLTKIFGAVVAGFTVSKIIDGLQAVTAEAAEAEEITNRMNLALKASGDYSDAAAREFEALADEIARTTKYDNDLVKSQVALAKQFNTTNKEAAKLIKAATQLASATGVDLSTAVQQLGQTLDGTAGRIAQTVPELQTLTAEQLRAGAAIDVVANRFKGFAEGELNTFNGAVAQSKNAYNDLLEAMGDSIVKNRTVIESYKQITKVLQAFGEYVSQNSKEISVFVSYGILKAVEAFGIMAQMIGVVVSQFEILVSQIVLVGTSFVGLWQILQTRVKVGFQTISDAAKKYKQDLSEIGKGNVFNKAAESLAGIANAIEDAALKTFELNTNVKKTADGFDEAGKKAREFNAELRQDFETLSKDLKNVGKTQSQILNETFRKYDDLVRIATRNGLKDRVNAEDIVGKLRIKYAEEAAKITEDSVKRILANPFKSFLPQQSLLSGGAAEGAAFGAAGAGAALSGAAGAKRLIGLAGSAVGDFIAPGLGQALGPIFEQLSQGPEAVKQMVTEFANALPMLIENLILAIPVLVETLADKMPDIIERLVERAPDIISKLVEDSPRIITKLIGQMPRVVLAFQVGILKGASQFVKKILEGAAQFVKKILSGASKPFKDVGKKFGDTVKNLFGGKSGGGGGGKNSAIGSAFNVGSIVGTGGSTGGLIGGIIGSIVRGLFKTGSPMSSPNVRRVGGGPSQLAVNVSVGRNQFAKAIVDVKRLGYRLEPV